MRQWRMVRNGLWHYKTVTTARPFGKPALRATARPSTLGAVGEDLCNAVKMLHRSMIALC